MRTSIVALALVALSPALVHGETLWRTDYTAAQEQAVSVQKALIVVFGQGTKGWQSLAGGRLSETASETVEENYVCCFVDTTTPEGQALAKKFDIVSVGLVISDRTGNHMAYWHQGTLPADNLSACLTRYADPQRPLVTTETNQTSRSVSYYPPTPGYIQPGYIQMGGPSGGIPCRT